MTQFVVSPTYVLVDAGGTNREWHSTSGPYVPGERLVIADDERWMIVDVRSSSSDESDVLVVEPYPSERGL